MLCAALPDASGAKPVFKLAMTRYAPYGRADADIAVVEADLHSGAENIRKAGTVSLEMGGQPVPCDLFLVELKLDHGRIQNLIYDDPHAALPFRDYLDIDLQGPGERSLQPAILSNLALLAITLEKVPVNMKVLQAEKGNIFHNDEKPRIPVELNAKQSGKYTLSWRISDVEEKQLGISSRNLELSAGEKLRLEIPVEVTEKGWFRVDFSLADAAGKVFSTRTAAVALLHPDSREFTGNSPYSIWFFGSSHQLAPDPESLGPILFKAGIRSFGCSSEIPEQEWAKWNITLNQIPYRGHYIYTDENILKDDPALWQRMENDYRTHISDTLKNFPGCRRIIVFHESYIKDYNERLPQLLLGAKSPVFDAQRERIEQARIKAATAICSLIRKEFPQLKIVFGNSCYAENMLESFAARGFDPGLIDYIGCEAVGGWTSPPESFSSWNPAGSSYLLREVSRLTGFNKKVTATYEWTCRSSNRNDLSPVSGHSQMIRQAQWILRDIMTAHAYHYELIPFAGITDTGTAYNNGRTYGALGICTRDLQPKPLYVAAAVATRILDQAVFMQQVPTDDPSVFLFEFQRKAAPRKVYVLWIPRGSAECRLLTVDSGPEIQSEDLFGRRGRLPVRDGILTVQATPSVRYLMTEGAIRELRLIQRNFDGGNAEPPALQSAKPGAADFRIEEKADPRIETYPDYNNRAFQAKFHVLPEVREVNDKEMGPVTSVSFDLSSLPQDHWNHGAYAMLKLNKPVPVPPEADCVGIWVKGNSSHGRLAWEVTDATGKSAISNGIPRDGSTMLNCAYENEFEFSSWRFLSMALKKEAARPADWFPCQWYSLDHCNMKSSLALTGILLSTSQKFARVSEFVPVQNQELRLGRIVFFRQNDKAAPAAAPAP